MPKVSIITPCFNSEAFITQTIQSVQTQIFKDWEHIVVDDGSRDRSVEIIQANLSKDSNVRLVQQQNFGVARARNVGHNNSSPDSKYLLFLDGDDFVKPEMLELMVSYLDRHPDVGVLYCDRTYTNADGEPIETPKFARYEPTRWGIRTISPSEPETPFSAVFNLAPIIPSVSLIRRSVYKQTEGWDEEFGQHYEDTNLFLNLAIRSRVHYIDQPLVYYRRHGNQSTASDDGKFLIQEKKLYDLWLNKKDLTLQQIKLVNEAWRFRTGRFEACIGFQSGNRLLRKGDVLKAIWFYCGAFRRYFISLLSSINVS